MVVQTAVGASKNLSLVRQALVFEFRSAPIRVLIGFVLLGLGRNLANFPIYLDSRGAGKFARQVPPPVYFPDDISRTQQDFQECISGKANHYRPKPPPRG
jgi:hypothetical protein